MLQESQSLLLSQASGAGTVSSALCMAAVRCMQAFGKGQNPIRTRLILASGQVIADQVGSDQVRSAQLSSLFLLRWRPAGQDDPFPQFCGDTHVIAQPDCHVPAQVQGRHHHICHSQCLCLCNAMHHDTAESNCIAQ